MVRIRLRRVGSKNQPSYRIIAADKESPRDGRFLENLGHYNPRTEPSTVNINEARLFHWLQHGAQPSDSVRKVLTPLGTWDRWERFKTGEDFDTLLEEAESSKLKVDPRTRRDDLFEQRRSKKSTPKKQEPSEVETPKEKPAPVEASIEELVEEAVEEKEVSEPAETSTEPEATKEEPESEKAAEEQMEEDEGDASELVTASTEDAEADPSEEQLEEPSEENDSEESED